jgi:hypothetical protein
MFVCLTKLLSSSKYVPSHCPSAYEHLYDRATIEVDRLSSVSEIVVWLRETTIARRCALINASADRTASVWAANIMDRSTSKVMHKLLPKYELQHKGSESAEHAWNLTKQHMPSAYLRAQFLVNNCSKNYFIQSDGRTIRRANNSTLREKMRVLIEGCLKVYWSGATKQRATAQVTKNSVRTAPSSIAIRPPTPP